MEHDVTPDFTTTFINRITNSLSGRNENLSETERIEHGNNHRSEHNRLRQPLDTDREHGRYLPWHCDAGSRSTPHPDHTGNHLCDLRDSGSCRGNDQRPGTRTLPVNGHSGGNSNGQATEAKSGQFTYNQKGCNDTLGFCGDACSACCASISNVLHILCNKQNNLHRSECYRLSQPVAPDRKHGGNIPRDCHIGCGSTTDIDNSRNHLCDLRNTRCSGRNDRASCPRTIQVKRTPFGSLQAPILLLLIACLIVPAIVVPALADVTVSFSPLNLDAETLMVHNSTGTLIGVYNTSTKGIVLTNNESYSILVQPESSNLLTNHPDEWFSNFLTYLQGRMIGILIIVFLVSILIAAYKRR